MRRCAALSLLLLWLTAVSAWAQAPVTVLQGTPQASGQVTVSDTATLLSTLATAAGYEIGSAHAIWFQVQTNGIRFDFGGTEPTADAGFVAAAGDDVYLSSPGYIRTIRVINDTALSNAVIRFVVEK